jgi:hypothetical protein
LARLAHGLVAVQDAFDAGANLGERIGEVESGREERLLAEYAALVEELQQREEEEGGRGPGGAESMDAA